MKTLITVTLRSGVEFRVEERDEPSYAVDRRFRGERKWQTLERYSYIGGDAGMIALAYISSVINASESIV